MLQLIDQMGDAGAENLIYTFAAGVDRSRFDVHVCALRPWPHPKLVPAIRAMGIPVIELDQHHSYDLPVLRALVSYIRREKIDIIHTHLLASDVMGRMAGFITRRPVVSTIHNARIDLDKEPRHQQLMEKWSARIWCRRLIVVSGLLHDEIAEWFGVPGSRVVTIPNGIDTERFSPAPGFDRAAKKRELLGEGGGNLRIVVNVARIMPQKAQQYLLQAAARVLPTRPDVRFVIVGDGPLRNDITEMARDLGIEESVLITGLRPDVPDILAAADLFVLSSLWEGMPLSLLEAMAAGCPAVATDVGGVGGVLEQGITGLKVPPADADALAEAISDSLDHPEQARERARAARTMVAKEYSKNTMIRRWEAVYVNELSKRR